MAQRPPRDTSDWTAALGCFATDLREEAEIYREIARETRRQFEAARKGDADGLMAIARRKQQGLARVGEIERRIDPVKRSWIDRKAEIPADLRSSVEEALGEVEESLGALIALEEEAGTAFAALHQETGAELQRIQSSRRLRTAYGAEAAAGTPRLLDGLH
ncbi:MAG: hypothetical protein JXP34_20280 [Planctomycetes bacterium]|nr:hypothetical protein [Planctomycetota bacterium]